MSPGLPPAVATSFVSATVIACAVLGAFGLARIAERRRRRERRALAGSLARLFEAAVADRLPRRDLREAVDRADAAAYWTALEGLAHALDRGAWRRLSAALAGALHAREERRALADDSPWRRELAARRLGLVREPRSRRALRRALAHGPALVSLAAAQALARYRDRGALRWLLAHPAALDGRTPRATAGVLAAWGREALPVLADALGAGIADAPLRRAVIDVLGAGGHRAAALAIEGALADPDDEVRVAAARALGRLEADHCAAALLGALRDERWPVRAQAARALGRARVLVAVDALAARTTDPVWWVRRHAAYALGALGEDGRRALRQIAYHGSDAYARDMALEVLGGGFRHFGR